MSPIPRLIRSPRKKLSSKIISKSFSLILITKKTTQYQLNVFELVVSNIPPKLEVKFGKIVLIYNYTTVLHL